MEFKGTKGKWEVYNPNHIGCINVSFGKNDGFTGYVELWHHYFENKEEAKANALLISKAPEMLEKLSEIVNILDIKCTDGCVNKTWGDFQNGNGEDVGLEIDKFIKDTKQLIKEATEL